MIASLTACAAPMSSPRTIRRGGAAWASAEWPRTTKRITKCLMKYHPESAFVTTSLPTPGGPTKESVPQHRARHILSRDDKLMSRGAHRQYRAGRLANDFLGDASQQHVGDGAAAVSSQNDQVDVVLTRIRDDFNVRASRPKGSHDLATLLRRIGKQPIERPFGLLLHVQEIILRQRQ